MDQGKYEEAGEKEEKKELGTEDEGFGQRGNNDWFGLEGTEGDGAVNFTAKQPNT